MPVAGYDAKREARLERLRRRAEKTREEAQNLNDRAHQIADGIPLGQPIISKQFARTHRKMCDLFERGYDKGKEASEQEHRARAAENNTAIFSDNPAAGELLEAKIARLEERQRLMKAANALIRKGDRQGLLDLGFSEGCIDRLMEPDFGGQVGYPGYALSNNSSNIRAAKKRLAEIEKHADDVTSEVMVGVVRIRDDIDENRIQVFYPSRPPDATITAFKRAGFHFSHANCCWQRLRKDGVFQYAQRLVKSMEEVSPSGETPRSAETEL